MFYLKEEKQVVMERRSVPHDAAYARLNERGNGKNDNEGYERPGRCTCRTEKRNADATKPSPIWLLLE
ncbi:unnamed protein product [Haemonchus placei]|uniref:Uncharacterized protein n=1 Tax=Haemonchus placei TaxID=6290 RepID=A0A0N4W8P3_HAEPC|nr:unnamed protein product [Haemonchus placei]